MYLTTGQVAQVLGVSIPTVRQLIASGAVPGIAAGGRQVFPLAAVQAMTRLPAAPLTALPGPEVAVLRVDTATPVDEDGRRWIGYSARLTQDELLPALRGWWRCDPARVAAGGILPVTFGGFVVAVLTNLGTTDSDGVQRYTRYRFTQARLAGYVTDLTNPVNATTPDPADAAGLRYASLLLGTRLVSQSGGPIAYVRTGAAAATTSSQVQEGGS